MAAQTNKKVSVSVRDAATADLEAIRSIYNHYVLNSTVTFDMNERTEDAQKTWFEAHREEQLPVLVAEIQGRIVGWASLSYYSQRCAYKTSVEPSVYLHPDFIRHGAGKTLMMHLISAARQRRYHCLIGLVCSENTPSLAWIQNFGFERVGELKEVGRKFDRWLDVTIMQKVLGGS
jgi:L-amino acid N-acyltransferase YncA